mmetsp:Transcript_28622/g.48704  ORF Transcript_28622/g.48704 Transcript_28622/m.48704 type:complete len:412 (-) Transcript_28622:1025-2260(-)
MLNPRIKPLIVRTQRNPHRLVIVVNPPRNRLKQGKVRPILAVSRVHSRTGATILAKVNILPRRSKHILIRLIAKLPLPVKLLPGRFGLVRPIFQIEDEHLQILLGHEVELSLVVADPLGVSVVPRRAVGGGVLVRGPFEVTVVEDAQPRVISVGVQRVPSVAPRDESTQGSRLVVLGGKKDGVVRVGVVHGDALVPSAPSAQLGLFGVAADGIDLPALSVLVFLAAHPGMPRRQSSAAVVGGSGEQIPVLLDVAIFIEVDTVHATVTITFLAIDGVDISAVQRIVGVHGNDTGSIRHGMIGAIGSITICIGDPFAGTGNNADGKAAGHLDAEIVVGVEFFAEEERFVGRGGRCGGWIGGLLCWRLGRLFGGKFCRLFGGEFCWIFGRLIGRLFGWLLGRILGRSLGRIFRR